MEVHSGHSGHSGNSRHSGYTLIAKDSYFLNKQSAVEILEINISNRKLGYFFGVFLTPLFDQKDSDLKNGLFFRKKI